MKKHLKSIISLFSICAVIAMLLALTNYFTAPIIKENEDRVANAALLEVLPDADKFEKISADGLPETITDVYKADNGGYVFKLNTSGYKNNLIIMCGVKADGSVSKAICISSEETLEKEKTYGDNFAGLSLDKVDTVDTIGGATKTTKAYRGAIKDALNAFNMLKGGNE